MSQEDASVADLLTMDPGSFTQTELDTLFNTVETDQIIFHLDNNEAILDPDFNFGHVSYPTLPECTALSPRSSTNSADCSFGQPYIDYPTPGLSTPHPYPIEQQQCFDHNIAGSFQIDQRPQVLRSLTDSSYLAPCNPPPGYARRRSLSQDDMDHIAAINAQAPNPTFMRLMTPYPRSNTPDSVSRKYRGGKHSRSSSRKSKASYREMQSRPTSVPHSVDDGVSSPLGNTLSVAEHFFQSPAVQQQWPVPNGYDGSNTEAQVIFRQMAGPHQIARSRKIVEIGAMSVTGAIDPRLQGNGEVILKKLEEIEWYLMMECGGCEEALKGCASIREALKRKTCVPSDHDRDGFMN